MMLCDHHFVQTLGGYDQRQWSDKLLLMSLIGECEKRSSDRHEFVC